MTSKTNSLVTGKSYTGRASDYQMYEARLYPNSENDSDNYVDISNIIAKTQISEEINTPFLEVSLDIADATGIIETYKINGGERINLLLQRKAPTADDDGKYDPDGSGVYDRWELELYIAEIADLIRNDNTMQFFKLHCTTIETYRNASTVLERPFTGSIADIIKNIIEIDLGSKKSNIENNSVGSVSGIFPRVRPMVAIHWLSSSAFDNGTPFMFFATAKDGLTYRSYSSMLNDKVYMDYDFSPGFKEEMNTGPSYFEQQKKVISISSPLNIAKAANIARGTYSSNVFTLDISNKSYDNVKYSYGDDMLKLNKFSPFNQPKDIKFDLNDQSSASTSYVAKNAGAYDGVTGNASGAAGLASLKAQSYISSLDYMTQIIQVNGDFNLTVGKKVSLTVIRVGDSKYVQADEDIKSNQMVDTFTSCNYLVTKVVSTFDSIGFYQAVTLKSDSSAIEL